MTSFDRSSQDVGNIVELGHVNLRVPDQQQALMFYVMGLGLTRDPYLNTGVDNLWINVGTSQFHLPTGPAQVLRGRVGLVMPDLSALLARLERIQPRLAGTHFRFSAVAPEALDVVCPWGNRIRIHAPDSIRFGRMLLGMPYVEIDIPQGAAVPLARFYREILATRTYLAADADGKPTVVHIPMGISEGVMLRETTQPLPAYDGHHIQITLADFSGVHQRLVARGLISEESNLSQYRFQDLIDLDSGTVLATLEHEVRSMRHPLYARALINRNPELTHHHYASGHEAAAWRMGPPTAAGS
jgi:catechol 2,3-dioxygenase-like lactoylglutathione lyase family enzyme